MSQLNLAVWVKGRWFRSLDQNCQIPLCHVALTFLFDGETDNSCGPKKEDQREGDSHFLHDLLRCKRLRIELLPWRIDVINTESLIENIASVMFEEVSKIVLG